MLLNLLHATIVVLLSPSALCCSDCVYRAPEPDCGNIMRGEARTGRGLHEKRLCVRMGNDCNGLIKRNCWMEKRDDDGCVSGCRLSCNGSARESWMKD